MTTAAMVAATAMVAMATTGMDLDDIKVPHGKTQEEPLAPPPAPSYLFDMNHLPQEPTFRWNPKIHYSRGATNRYRSVRTFT